MRGTTHQAIKTRSGFKHIRIERRELPSRVQPEIAPEFFPVAQANSGHSGHEIADDAKRLLTGEPMQFPKIFHGGI